MCGGSELCPVYSRDLDTVEGSGDLTLSSEGDNRAGKGHACIHEARGTRSPHSRDINDSQAVRNAHHFLWMGSGVHLVLKAPKEREVT